jgi:hypothetical protein
VAAKPLPLGSVRWRHGGHWPSARSQQGTRPRRFETWADSMGVPSWLAARNTSPGWADELFGGRSGVDVATEGPNRPPLAAVARENAEIWPRRRGTGFSRSVLLVISYGTPGRHEEKSQKPTTFDQLAARDCSLRATIQ